VNKPIVLILASHGGQASPAALEEIEALGLPTMLADHSRGYAGAVRDGFDRAAAAGYTHAITLDVDQQHQPTDLPAFIAAIELQPHALITGVRHFRPCLMAWAIKLAATFCDFWIWCANGRWTRDCAHAYRAYPLAEMSEITCSAVGQEFELEVLVKAVWCDVKTASMTVHVPAEFRIDVMSPVEFVRFGVLINSLLLRRLLVPTPLLATLHRGEFGRLPRTTRIARITKDTIAHHCDHPLKFATAVGVGVFFGVSPLWGFQMLLSAGTAQLLRLSKTVTVAASNISLPLTIPLFIYGGLLVGHFLHYGELRGVPQLHELSRSVLLNFLGEYIVGSLVLGVVLGSFFGLAAYVMALRIKARRQPISQTGADEQPSHRPF